MIARTIIRMGNPILGRIASPVGPEHASCLAPLLSDMVEAMRAADGVGLAAPQIGVSLRVIIFEVPPSRASDDPNALEQSLQALINPEIEILDDRLVLDWEGCISIPGLRGEVPRYARIRYRGLDGEGNRIEREATGFHARVIQHEVDHLDGILYPERMTDMRRFGFVEEYLSQMSEPDDDTFGQQS